MTFLETQPMKQAIVLSQVLLQTEDAETERQGEPEM